jgi:hypothetical protein
MDVNVITMMSARRNAGRRLASLLLSAVGAIALLATSSSPAGAAVKQLVAVLNAGQEVPTTDSAALGVAHLTYDTQTKMLCYSISYTGLEGGQNDELQSHFHGPAPAGQNGDVLFSISPGPSPVGSPKSGCVGPLEKDHKKALLKGELYINVHTNQFANGEIRGQVLPIK